MTQETRYILELRVVHPQRVFEEETWHAQYFLKNVGEEDFPGGAIDLRLSYMGYSGFSVIHFWALEPIHVNNDLILEPLPIRAVAGMNAFVFLRCVSVGNTPNVLVLNINGDPLSSGSIFGALTIKTVEERRSIRNMKITAISLFAMVFFQFFNWFYDAWLNNKSCFQNAIYIGFVLLPILLIIAYKEWIS